MTQHCAFAGPMQDRGGGLASKALAKEQKGALVNVFKASVRSLRTDKKTAMAGKLAAVHYGPARAADASTRKAFRPLKFGPV